MTSIPISPRTTARFFFLLFAAASLAGLTGCFKPPGAENAEGDGNANEEQAIPVEVAALTRGEIESVLTSSWSLEAEREVKVLARTSNRLKELLVEEGDEVEKGDVLAVLEDREQRTALDRAEVQVAKLEAEYRRIESLYQQNLVSEQVYTDTQFELKQLQLSADDARLQLEYTQIRAPISGTVSRRHVKVGDIVANNANVFDIVDFTSMVVYLSLSDANLIRLETGQPARITTTSIPGEVFPGFIKRISPVVDARTGTVKVTVGLKDYGRLRPGMYVDVEIVLDKKKDALLMTKRAFVYDGEQRFVFRLKPDSRRVERVLVEPALEDRLWVEPKEGFAEGDLIVVAGQTGLKDDALVRLPEDPEPEKDKGADGKTTDIRLRPHD